MIEPEPKNPRYVVTIPGIGYRFRGSGHDSIDRPEGARTYWRQLLTTINFEMRIHPLSATDGHLERYKIKNKLINCDIKYTFPLEVALPFPADGGSYPLPGFLDGGIGQADDGKGRQTRGNVCLDLNNRPI